MCARGTSPRLGFLSRWTIWMFLLCGASAFEKPPGAISPLNSQLNKSVHKEMSLRFRQLSNLNFVEEGKDYVQSEEEVIRCQLYLVADFPMGLIAEAAILLRECLWTILKIRDASVILLPGYFSSPSVSPDVENPANLALQTFQFGFAVLPPTGGSEDLSIMLRDAAEYAVLTRFKELVLASPAMKMQEAKSSTNGCQPHKV